MRRSDAGFTLVELLITIVILGVITLPLGNFVIEYFRYTADTTSRLNESHDVQIASAYFAQDVAGVGTRNPATQVFKRSVWVGNTSGAPYTCGSATPLILFVSDLATGPGTPDQVEIAYVATTAGGEHQLRRVYCAGPAASPVTSVLAHDVDPDAAPSVRCFLGQTDADCSGLDTAMPTAVQLTLTLKDAANRGASSQVILAGQRRQS